MNTQAPDVAAARSPSAARKIGLRNLVIGALLVGATLGTMAWGAAAGWATLTLSGVAFLLSWIYVGFGLGEVIFGGRFRVATMLIALIVGVGGIGLNFYILRSLGYQLARR